MMHSAVCTFELSSSSCSSERSDWDEDEVLDEETDTCCSDEGDDGMISDYLTSSRISDSAANCSLLGCQTENIFVASEDCDLNANCKTLYHSNMEAEHLRLAADEDCDSVTDEIENVVDEKICHSFAISCAEMRQYPRDSVDETVMTSKASCVVQTDEIRPVATRPGAVDVSVQVDENIDVSDQNSDTVASAGHFTDSHCLRHEDVVDCNEHAHCESSQSQTTCEPSVCGLESVSRCGSSLANCGSRADSREGMPCALMQAAFRSNSYHMDSNFARTNVAIDPRNASLSEAVVNAADLTSPLPFSSKTSTEVVISSNYETVAGFNRTTFNPCTSSPFQNAALGSLWSNAREIGHVTSSASVSVMSPQQFAVKPQDMLTSSASLVWPSATVSPSMVGNRSSLTFPTTSAIHTRLLATPWVPVGVVTTASIVIPAALPNAAGAAWVRPVNIAQPVYALGQTQVQLPRLSQPVPLIQQFVPHAVMAPVMWIAPQMSLMNAVKLCRPLHPASVSTDCLPSQQSASSTFASNIPSASQQSVLSQCRNTVSDHSPCSLQNTVSNIGVQTASCAAQMTPSNPRVSGFRLPPNASALVSCGSVQSACGAAPASHQSAHHLVLNAALSRQVAVLPPATAAAVPALYSTSTPSPCSTSLKQLQVNYNPSASLMQLVSSVTALPLAVSKYHISSGGVSVTWSSGTTPVTVSSGYEQRQDVLTMPGTHNLQAAACRTEAGVNADVATAAEGRTFSACQTPRVNSLLPVSTVSDTTSAAYSQYPTVSCGVSIEHLLLSAAACISKPQPNCFTTLSASAIPSPGHTMSVPAVTMNSLSSGTVSAMTNSFSVAGNSAKSPRLIIQPSSLAAGTESDVLKLAQSVYKTQPYSVAHLPPVTTSRPNLPTSSGILGRLQTCDVEFVELDSSSTNSQLVGNAATSLSNCCNAAPLPWAVSGTECLVDSVPDQQICSPVADMETKSSAGKYGFT